MSPEQVRLLRRLAINDRDAMNAVMSGDLQAGSALNARTAALVRITALLCVDADVTTVQWAAELGVAAGLEDDAIFDALLVIAPMIGVARLASSLPHLMAALDLELVEG